MSSYCLPNITTNQVITGNINSNTATINDITLNSLTLNNTSSNLNVNNITTNNLYTGSIRGLAANNIDIHNDIQPINNGVQNLGTNTRFWSNSYINIVNSSLVATGNTLSTNNTLTNLISINNTITNLVSTFTTLGSLQLTNTTIVNLVSTNTTNTNLRNTNSSVGTLNCSLINAGGTVGYLNTMTNFQSVGELRIGRSDNVQRYHSITCTNDTTIANNYLRFWVSTEITQQNLVMTLRGDSRVGINTTVPASTLDVNGKTTTIDLTSTNQTLTNLLCSNLKSTASTITLFNDVIPNIDNTIYIGTSSNLLNSCFAQNFITVDNGNNYKSFTKGSTTLTDTTFTRANIFLGGGGAYDVGANTIGTPSNGLYRIVFTSRGDTGATANSISYRLRNNTTAVLTDNLNHIVGGNPAALSTTRIEFIYKAAKNDIIEIQVLRTNIDVTGWIINDGYVERLKATTS